MHYIEKNLDGSYSVGIYGQSGYERATYGDRESAIRGYQYGMVFLNGLKGKPSDVAPPPIVDKSSWPVVNVVPPNGISIGHDEVGNAIELALSRQQLEVGRRYEFRVVLVRVEGESPGFVGEGI